MHGKVGSRANSSDSGDGARATSLPAIGKRPLVQQEREGAVQRVPAAPDAGNNASVAAPKSGIDKAGFIDHGDGANIRTGPAESGGKTVRNQPLPPATRVFVSGCWALGESWRVQHRVQ
jgi:hypothetical protein